LPDPFQFQNGTRVKAVNEWRERREEISRLAQKFQYGTYPVRPEKVTGTVVSENRLVVTVEGSETRRPWPAGLSPMSYWVGLYRPAGPGPFPAVIGVFETPGLTARDLNARGVALIDLETDIRAIRVVGANNIMARAWHVGRVVDALETTPGAGIDTKRIGVAGYGRYATAALIAGAIDERIKLTILLEPGCGVWRGRKERAYRFGSSMMLQED
jgi:hypothetical protein